jgi:tetratricopeptide (TPR) repeat protein
MVRAKMKLNRWLAILLFLSSSVSVFGDEAAELRKELKSAKGKDRISILQDLYNLSLDSDDVGYQLKCINQVIDEAHRQGEKTVEGEARVQKMTLFYNADLNDSIYEQVPPTLEFLESTDSWKNYYETWTLLVEALNFTGQTNTGLKEGQQMYEDAKKRDDKYGMGMAYYAMGNVYANMNNIDEASSSYQKSLDMLADVKPVPMQLSDIYADYVDVLEVQKKFHKISDITDKWSTFLTNYYEEKGNDYDASNRWGYYYLACAQGAIGLGELERASEMLDEVKKRCIYEDGFLNQKWLYYRAELCRLQGFYDEAMALNDRRMRMMDETTEKMEILRVRQQRAQIYEGIGRYQEAARLYREMFLINDSINVHDTKRQLTEMNTLFRVDEIKMQEERQRAQQQRLGIIIIASIIVIALAIFLFFRIRSAKRLRIAHEKL